MHELTVWDYVWRIESGAYSVDAAYGRLVLSARGVNWSRLYSLLS